MPTSYGTIRHRSAKAIRPKERSPAERGYGPRWRRYSEAFRKRHPFCARCLEQGRTTLVVLGRTGVVDHKIPVSAGGPMWDPANHWTLCHSHHSGWKARLEAYARETGQVDQLIRWCDDPLARPTFRGDTDGLHRTDL